ncbi:MAG: DNA repair protein RecO [Firmicutes bacterium]|nr:DNA repair protein RecO [Bacillota bacterium]
MHINAEGIVFRQVKIAGGRKMVHLFTKKYGKISAGSSISEKSRTKSALALQLFTYGNYELYKSKEYYNVNSGEVKKTFFKIAEDVDKYMQASLVLELTEKLIPEELPQPRLFNLLIDFLGELEKREKKHETLVLAYEVKALELLGSCPVLDQCACCGSKENLHFFSIKDGGMVCTKCGNIANDTLIYQPKFDIVNILRYFLKTPISAFGKIALDEAVAKDLQDMLRKYMSYYFDIGTLKSESFFEEIF